MKIHTRSSDNFFAHLCPTGVSQLKFWAVWVNRALFTGEKLLKVQFLEPSIVSVYYYRWSKDSFDTGLLATDIIIVYLMKGLSCCLK